jgi:hypothetical protein
MIEITEEEAQLLRDLVEKELMNLQDLGLTDESDDEDEIHHYQQLEELAEKLDG